jgi:hypothetical protein
MKTPGKIHHQGTKTPSFQANETVFLVSSFLRGSSNPQNITHHQGTKAQRDFCKKNLFFLVSWCLGGSSSLGLNPKVLLVSWCLGGSSFL